MKGLLASNCQPSQHWGNLQMPPLTRIWNYSTIGRTWYVGNSYSLFSQLCMSGNFSMTLCQLFFFFTSQFNSFFGFRRSQYWSVLYQNSFQTNLLYDSVEYFDIVVWSNWKELKELSDIFQAGGSFTWNVQRRCAGLYFKCWYVNEKQYETWT